MKQLIYDYFWHLFFLLAIAWYWGFVSGKWWEQEKNKDQQGNDEIWW